MNKKILSGSTLKIIAVIAMTLDHFGQIILKNGIIMNATYSQLSDSQFAWLLYAMEFFHILGRIAFPIFCFLIVEGFYHTHNIKKYILHLFIFAIISEPIYDLAFYGNLFNFNGQNVLFTLLLGLTAITILNKFHDNFVLALVISSISSVISYYLRMDGWYYGIILIMLFYIFREKNLLKYLLAGFTMFACALNFSIKGIIDPYFITALSSLILISLYNQKRGLHMKYFFYAFYPGHIILLYSITTFILIPYLQITN